MTTNTDLPAGYRWATAEETEDYENVPGIIVVPLTTDANGQPYTQGEADLAVPDCYCELGYECLECARRRTARRAETLREMQAAR